MKDGDLIVLLIMLLLLVVSAFEYFVQRTRRPE